MTDDARAAAPFILLTPGPLTTTPATRAAMLHDYGSWDRDFQDISARVCAGLLALAGGEGTHATVPLQGSGTFAVEAMLTTFVPRDRRLLICANGAYGERMVAQAMLMGLDYSVLRGPEDAPTDTGALAAALARDPAISHVAAVYVETTSGIANPLDEIAGVTRRAGRRLLVDAIAAFGALPFDAGRLGIEAMAGSANKCIEGVPGFGFVIAERRALADARGRATSLSLDLAHQHAHLEATGRWRYTPPTQVVAAFDAALAQHAAEGGQPARLARYAANCRVLVEGMRALGFRTFLDDAVQAPVIVTFFEPADPAWSFNAFYAAMRARGFIIYPGKVTEAPTFRIGCIGAIDATVMRRVVDAAREALAAMGVTRAAPVP